MAGRSIVEYFSDNKGFKCGYCGNEDTSYSHGMWAHTMTVQDYQDLIDRGFRRSGMYVYKPTMDKTCCPQYTIKCSVLEYKISRSQKKILKRVNKYLNTGLKSGDGLPENPAVGEGSCELSSKMVTEMSQQVQDDILGGKLHSVAASEALTKPHLNVEKPVTSKHTEVSTESAEKTEKPEKHKASCSNVNTPQPVKGPDPDRPQAKKAKLIRQERWKKKHPDVDCVPKKNKNNEAKTLDDFLQEISKSAKHKLEVRLVRSSPQSPEFEATFEEAYQIYLKYQVAIHKDDPSKPTKRQYTRFLVDSPLQAEFPDGGLECGFGSFHQQYILDGKIIAVGVIDILPHCVSSVYLFYDPDVSFLSLGTYSALREVAFTQSLHLKQPSITQYYMGFYIHTCPKMKYKGQYFPSYLLCPESYTWHPIEQCSPKLDAKNYSRFADATEVDANGNIELGNVLVLHRRQAMPFMIYKALCDEEEEDDDDDMEILEYASLVGRTCAERMLVYRK